MLGTENLGEQALNKVAELAVSSQLEDFHSLEVKVNLVLAIAQENLGHR